MQSVPFTQLSVMVFQDISIGPQFQATVPILHLNRHSEKGKAASLVCLVWV